MADIWLDVDTALTAVAINKVPIVDVDGLTVDTGMVYNEAGLSLEWNFMTSAGVFTHTAVTPTDTAGVYDFVNQGEGMYTIEIPASGGGTINNDTEGYGWFSGNCTANLPWVSPTYGFRAAAINDALCDGGDLLDVNTTQWLGTAAATPTTAGVPEVDVTFVSGTAQTANDNGADVNTLITEVAKVPKSDSTVSWNATALAAINAEADTALTDYDPPTNAEMLAATAVTDALVALAQLDLDTITGTDGVTLATAQALYAPAKAGDNMGTVSSVTGNVDGNVTGSVGSNLELGPAEVNTEVDNAMVTYGLDHLLSASVTGTDVTDNSVIASLVSASATADWDDFVNTTDSLQAVRDHIGDGTNLTEAGGTGDHLTESGGTGDQFTALDVYSIAGNAQAATNLSASARSMQILTVNTGNVAASTTTAQFTGVTEATADHFIGRKLFFYDSGDALFLQGTSITDSSWDATNSEVVLTFQQLTDTPADADVAILV